MTDIVERLRDFDSPWEDEQTLRKEAAAEIERLRKEVDCLRRDNHSLWGSLRNRMAADATRTLPR